MQKVKDRKRIARTTLSFALAVLVFWLVMRSPASTIAAVAAGANVLLQLLNLIGAWFDLPE